MPRSKSLERAIASIPRNRKITHPHGLAGYAVDGQTPEAVVFPNTIEEVSNLLAVADQDGKAVVPWGGGTGMGLGNLARRVDLVMGTSRLNRILEYEPADLTVIVEGGTSLGVLQDELARNGQFLPMDPPRSENATIGGILATNASGPRRALFGTPRDRLIGIKVVHPNGDVTKSGGKVVKNVSGYDMNKLYTGSLGTLGIIVEAAFKIAPLFKETRSLLIACSSLDKAAGLALDIPKVGVQPMAQEIMDPQALGMLSTVIGRPPDGAAFGIALQLGGTPAAVARQESEVQALCEKAKAEVIDLSDKEVASRLWAAIRDFGRDQQQSASMIVETTCLPSEVASMMDEISSVREKLIVDAAVMSDITDGIIYSYWWAQEGSKDALKAIVAALRDLVTRFNGHCVVELCPIELKGDIDVWGISGPQTVLMKRIKEQFDPRNTLNPGRFVDGI